MMKLRKSLYGLPDSSINWCITIRPLVEIGVEPLKFDMRAYVYQAKEAVIIIFTLYADDLLVLGGDAVLFEMLNKKLMSRFKMTDMGNTSRVHGIKSPATARRAF